MSRPAPGIPRSLRFTTTALRWLKPALSWKFATLWLIVAVNLVLIALYFWSRGGATTTVRIEAIGSQYRAFVDGTLIAEATFGGRDRGGIGFRLSGDEFIPSLAQPSGIDSVRVTVPDTGEVIFEDDFGGSSSDLWNAESGDWYVHDGVFSTPTGGAVTTGFRSWGDYILEVKLQNVPEAAIYVRADDSRNTVAFGIRSFRHYNSSLLVLENGDTVQRQVGGGLHLDRGQTIQSMTAMLLRPYPTVALIVVGIVALALAVRLTWLERGLLTAVLMVAFGLRYHQDLRAFVLGRAWLEWVFLAPALMVAGVIVLAFVLRPAWLEEQLLAAGRSVMERTSALVLGLALGVFVLLWYLNYVVGEAMPHVPDSVLYVFQAKIFTSFRLTADAPPVRESFSIFNPHMLQVVDGRWFSHYLFGHPLFLAVGQFFGAVWLVPPVLGASSVVLIYWLGKRVYGAIVGLLAAVLLLFSPFFQMTASNFMSHNTAVFVILASLFFLTRPLKRRMLAMFLSGLFVGLLFNMRPLTAVAFIPVLGAFMGYELLRAGNDRARIFREDLAFVAGGVLLLLAYFFYNQSTTGDFLQSPYALQGTFRDDTFGFGGRHSVAIGLQNQRQLLAFMLLVANGWPVAIGLFLAALPFVLGTRNRWDYFLAASAFAIAAANILYKAPAVMHGPRFWYETMPFVILLTARGVQSLRDVGSTAGNWLAGRGGWVPSVSTGGVTSFAVFGLVAGLVVFSAWGWMLEEREAWRRIDFVPQRMSMLDGFNFTDRRLLDEADQLELKNALVVVEECANWWCYGSVFWTNSPDLDSEVVWAELHGTADDRALLEHFEGRNLYLANYAEGTIRPVTEAEIIRDIAEPAPEERPQAPEVEEVSASERDEIRRRDLETLRQALERYAEQNGSYPDTSGKLQTLCVYRQADAGCALTTVLPKLPSDPLGSSSSDGYWYLSDGTSFLLIAQQEEMEVERDQCPEEVVRRAGKETRYCVQGQAP